MGASSEVDDDGKEEIKRQYRALIGKATGAPEVTGRGVAGWVRDGHLFEKAQVEIQDVKVLTGTKRGPFFVVIGLVALILLQ